LSNEKEITMNYYNGWTKEISSEQRAMNRACANASNEQLLEWYRDLSVRRRVERTFAVYIEIVKLPADLETVTRELFRRLETGEMSRDPEPAWLSDGSDNSVSGQWDEHGVAR
jgi:ribosomal protein L20A (L18A)